MIIVDDEKCCACRACVQACPQNAISITEDEYKFERISIDSSKCVGCDKCKRVCPMLNDKKNSTHFQCGAAYAIDEKCKFAGSSGGLFGIFANNVIEKGGVVYGAAFDDELNLKTTRAENKADLNGLFKSKYLLCDTDDSFSLIKHDLDDNKIVLYCASPCQISGLLSYLNKSYNNLLCVDFICHGVGGQKQFRESVNYIENKKKIKIKEFGFREKFTNASSHYYYYYYKDLVTGEEKTKKDIYMTFPYYYAYCDRLTCREICYACPFASKERVGDITIGDFHNINKFEPEIDRFAGVSMFICNTTKGQDFFNLVRAKLYVKEFEISVLFDNNRFSGDEILPQKRMKYLIGLSKNKYDDVVRKFFNYKLDWRYYYYKAPKWVRYWGNRIIRRS